MVSQSQHILLKIDQLLQNKEFIRETELDDMEPNQRFIFMCKNYNDEDVDQMYYEVFGLEY